MTDIDDRIRSLVASAVADAPAAPEIDTLAAAPPRPHWGKRGVLALAALLAGIGGVAVLQPADDTDVDTGRDTTTTTAVAPAPAPPIIVTAGPEGIVEIVGDQQRTVTTEPMAFALALDDGTFVAQRARGADSQRGDNTLVVDYDGAMRELFPMTNFAGHVIVHDFAVVDGRRLLLYSVEITGDPETAREPLKALDLDSNETIELGNIGGWESGTGRLHLGANGLVAGTMFSEASHALLVLAIPGSPAAAKPLPTAKDYGLAEFYNDCGCPDGFVLNASGENLYWLEPGSDGAVIKVSAVGFPAPVITNRLPEYRAETVGGIDIDVSQRGIVFSAGAAAEASRPFLLKDDGTREYLPGAYATVGPNG